MQYEKLYSAIDKLLRGKSHILLAIDGNSAAGKSTLAARLRSQYSCNLIHMDDFFLQPSQRTPQRLAEPGGNIDYERFSTEVLRPLRAGEPFSYRPYDCKTQSFAEPISVKPNALNIVEGVYSIHPLFASLYDLKVFMRIDSEQQKTRLQERGAELYKKFTDLWLPMENEYFKTFKTQESCDIVLEEG